MHTKQQYGALRIALHVYIYIYIYIYIIIYIYYIALEHYISQENAWSSSGTTCQRQLLSDLLDVHVSQSTYLRIFRSQKGSVEALNFHHRLHHNYLITAKKVNCYWGCKYKWVRYFRIIKIIVVCPLRKVSGNDLTSRHKVLYLWLLTERSYN